jgi:hypothetical protein
VRPGSACSKLSLKLHRDGGVSFGETDVLVLPVRSFIADAQHQLLPNPLAAQDAAMPRWLAIVRWPGGGAARQIIRDVYTNGRWSTFRQASPARGCTDT